MGYPKGSPIQPQQPKERAIRILSFDIEASNLNADFGILLTAGYKIVGDSTQPQVLRIDDYLDETKQLIKAERRLLVAVSEALIGSDAWLTHYGRYYDIPFVNSRLLYHKLPILPEKPHIDTWKVARYKLKLRNNRLNTIQEFLGTKTEKNAIKPEQWLGALAGDKKSLDYIVEHNRRDVLALEEAYLRLRPLVSDHPNTSLFGHIHDEVCPVCNSTHVQSRGTRATRTRLYRMFQCMNCGKWFSGRKPIQIAQVA